jgi:hypothetical protein
MRRKKQIYIKYPVLLLIIGIIGLAGNLIYMISLYTVAASPRELVRPIIYSFIPFIICFIIFRLGVKGFVDRNK